MRLLGSILAIVIAVVLSDGALAEQGTQNEAQTSAKTVKSKCGKDLQDDGQGNFGCTKGCNRGGGSGDGATCDWSCEKTKKGQECRVLILTRPQPPTSKNPRANIPDAPAVEGPH